MHEVFQIERSESGGNLYIFFGGLAAGVAMPPFEFFNASRILDENKIFVRDLRQQWYQTGLEGITRDIPSTAQFLAREIEKTAPEKIVFVGNSMGGFAAILFCALLGRGEAIAFAPQSFISPWLRLRHGDARWRRPIVRTWVRSLLKPRVWNLRHILKRTGIPTRISIYVSSADRLDRIHAAHLEDLPGVRVREFDDGGHGVVRLLRDRGELPEIMKGSPA
jgi:pimeloyl-ACP methyl ester carboxylesterase